MLSNIFSASSFRARRAGAVNSHRLPSTAHLLRDVGLGDTRMRRVLPVAHVTRHGTFMGA